MAARRESGRGTVQRLTEEIDVLERQVREAEVSFQELSEMRVRQSGGRTGSYLPREPFRKPIIMPDSYDGQTKWDSYLAHFVACSEINGWTDEEKASFLVARLKGHPQEIYMGLPPHVRGDFGALVKELSQFFEPEAMISVRRARLRSRVRAEGESLTKLCSSVRREVVEAYPCLDSQARDELAIDFFVGALRDRDLRIAVRRRTPKTLCETLHIALEVEAIDSAEGVFKPRRQACTVATSDGAVGELSERLSRLEMQVGRVLENQTRPGPVANQFQEPPAPPAPGVFGGSQCWRCGQLGHFRRECPFPPNGQNPLN